MSRRPYRGQPINCPQHANPPSYCKVNPADQSILYIALTSPTLPLYILNDYGETVMAQRISMVTGVAQVLVYGSRKYAVEVAGDVKRLLPAFQARLPASVSLHVLYDRSQSIRESVRDIKFTLVFTLGLVVLVIFLFLRRVSDTIIPSLGDAHVLIGTFMVIYMLGYSLDDLSLMALILAVGVVMVIYRDAGKHRAAPGDG